MKYVVVQHTGFVPYFLSAWSDGADNWIVRRAYALTFDGPTAHRIADRLNARRPGAIVPVTVEEVRP